MEKATNNLYQAVLMDHYRHPRHRGELALPDFTSQEHNPSCGDSVAFQGCVAGSTLTVLAFTGSGCVISQAAASLLAEKLTGASLADANSFTPENMLDLIAMPTLGPTRLKCALLALDALRQGIQSYTNHNGK